MTLTIYIMDTKDFKLACDLQLGTFLPDTVSTPILYRFTRTETYYIEAQVSQSELERINRHNSLEHIRKQIPYHLYLE